MWLKDDGGADIKGSSTVQDREGSIEIISFSHGVNLPVDAANGKITGARSHSPIAFEKEAVAKGQTLQSAEIKWYRINDAGKEEVYFVMTIEGVKVCGINPGMANTRLAQASALNHVEAVSMMDDRITWHYLDGNIKYTDSWNERG
ncbi:type VI secretion system tube protein TssD [Paraburkholderia sp. MM5384-R2]|uniref:Hcp family type VI secretion system effector n=1 Tax=Paraburkholderia sp. MM5384-R2 TaxID=2723097 RepID=UPI00182E2B17|nr:type VI secretion system tube protein TssD [Paraburkholderia sp. MM5384-R2]MBB5496634.1 type VI secretion system secreted protein Hcp [Paraburkholderia sp. MM5384-R2]